MNSEIAILTKFVPVTLEEAGAVKLMNRIDTKFLVARSALPGILNALKNDYFIQENLGKRIAQYHNLYYDTPNIQMYLAHHNRKLTRQKLRARIYCDTNEAFCEIKNKNNKQRTKKKRIAIPIEEFGNMLDAPATRLFVTERLHYEINTLRPQVENTFNRITLINYKKTERLTIDMNIKFQNRVTGQTAEIPELVIIELKQDGNTPSFFKQLLRDFRIKPKRISKYCLGTILTNPDAKNNRFIRKLRYINKITDSDSILKSTIL